MKGALFWVSSTVLAFAVTAGVFLALAELGTDPQRSLSAAGDHRAEPRSPLSISFQRSELQSLQEMEGQTLSLTLSNSGDRRLTDISVYLIVSSEDTASRETRYYEAPVEELDLREAQGVSFTLDLSPPEPKSGTEGGPPEEESFNILEVRAASSEGVSTVKTAVLSF